MVDKSEAGVGARHRNGAHTPSKPKLPAQQRTGSRTQAQNAERGSSNALNQGLATALLVGAGALLFEAELLPGILIGAGAVLAPRLFRGLGETFRPLARNAVRAGYAAAIRGREMAEQAREEIEDIVAEAQAEQDHAEEEEEEEAGPAGRTEGPASSRKTSSRRG
jgi:hypothetical protein